jgi:hypothetical protein
MQTLSRQKTMRLLRLFITSITLLFGLAFYMAYRTDQTVACRCLGMILGEDASAALRHTLQNAMDMPTSLRGCLPSFLWVLAVTSVLLEWRVVGDSPAFRRSVSLAPIGFFLNAVWEGVQWLRFTDGRADLSDIIAGGLGWLVAAGLCHLTPLPGREIRQLRPGPIAIVVGCFAIMGLADVWK